ncbi:MAG: C4-dicarboxylate ABC transporter permease, partial [Alcaligenes sp.]
MTEALIGFAAMLLLIFLRVPVAFSMALVGFMGVGIMRNWPSAYAMTGAVVRE